MLACMAVLAGVPAAQAVEWVRDAYARRAVERQAQADWVAWFADRHVGRAVLTAGAIARAPDTR